MEAFTAACNRLSHSKEFATRLLRYLLRPSDEKRGAFVEWLTADELDEQWVDRNMSELKDGAQRLADGDEEQWAILLYDCLLHNNPRFGDLKLVSPFSEDVLMFVSKATGEVPMFFARPEPGKGVWKDVFDLLSISAPKGVHLALLEDFGDFGSLKRFVAVDADAFARNTC